MNELIQKTADALKKNSILPFIVDKKEDVIPLVKTLVSKEESITSGGSMTLAECGLIDFFKENGYNYVDRNSSLLSPQERRDIEIKTYGFDCFMSSSNAVTENGMLYNVDGISNRTSAIAYGPKSVIIIVGVNKIVKNLDEAVARVKSIAAPKNTKRLNCDTPCAKTGHCISNSKSASDMTDGCSSPTRICCNYLVCAKQRIKDRIKVILVNESLGY